MLTSDQALFIVLLNNIIRREDYPELYKKDRVAANDGHVLFPGEQPVFPKTTERQSAFQWNWLLPRGLKKVLLSQLAAFRKTGNPSFELSRKQALGRANSWKIPAQAKQTKVPGFLGVSRSKARAQVTPFFAGEIYHVREDQAPYAASEKSTAPSAAVSEEHSTYEISSRRN